ncbi:hypothetical protein AC481_06540 [miscellaneous Crenarchaeota group archaeon SMTZ-80]|nr:MAG: hypothetical protein AC481_06540 [miscellaneous Crenarchaeota group archaeon SMTZ-80]
MKKIAVFTTSRADFGILSPLIRAIIASEKLQLLLFAGGAHLKAKTGFTIKEIEKSGFKISETFDYLLNSDEDSFLARSLGTAIIKVSKIFSKYDFDMVCILGDRFELLSIVANAILFRKPIVHIHGGEKSEGSIDEQIRHMITKASHLHFAACEEYSQNIRNMGEADWRVYNTGALTIDNIVNITKIEKTTLFDNLGLDKDKDTILLTYHPVTLELEISSLEQITNVFKAIREFDYQVIITSPNVDKDSSIIDEFIIKQVNENQNYKYFRSLGYVNYLCLIPYCKFVIGNSSSGIIEVPYFKKPTVNIGCRQRGRILHDSVINTDYSVRSIVEGIKTACSPEFINSIVNMEFKFGNGSAAHRMTEILEKIEINSRLMQKQLIFS